jgi:hypothetical protein
VLAVTGITNKRLRALMTGLLGGADYTKNLASYDLARMRINGLITRIPGKNTYAAVGGPPDRGAQTWPPPPRPGLEIGFRDYEPGEGHCQLEVVWTFC